MNNGKLVETITVSAPERRDVTNVADGAMMKSTSPVSNACMTIVLALIAITSAFRPFFLKKPFRSATQIGVFDGVLPAQAMRIRSWAVPRSAVEREKNIRTTNIQSDLFMEDSFWQKSAGSDPGKLAEYIPRSI